MNAQATKHDVSVEIPAKSPDFNLEITFDDNLEINTKWVGTANAIGWRVCSCLLINAVVELCLFNHFHRYKSFRMGMIPDAFDTHHSLGWWS